jgi:hypothetical protein
MAPLVLDKYDVEKIRDAQDKVREDQIGREAFRRDFKVRAKSVDELPKGHPKFKKRVNLPPHIWQAEAKHFIPPGSTICLGNTRNEWWGHFEPNTRVSAPFAKHKGSQDALRYVLKALWRRYLERFGLDDERCPYAELLVDGDVALAT